MTLTLQALVVLFTAAAVSLPLFQGTRAIRVRDLWKRRRIILPPMFTVLAVAATAAVGLIADQSNRAELARNQAESAQMRSQLERVEADARLKGEQLARIEGLIEEFVAEGRLSREAAGELLRLKGGVEIKVR